MARYTRLQVLNAIMETGTAPVFYRTDIEVARRVAGACASGGYPLPDFTNRGDHAWEVFTELEQYCAREAPELIFGVGRLAGRPAGWSFVSQVSANLLALHGEA
jgi:2-dehydro-3-deoxyphosphogluconate aldolase / (4S)-4-hydroxy-2-oxoglutarate aldolase